MSDNREVLLAALRVELRTTASKKRKAEILAEIERLGERSTVIAPKKETR